MAFLLVFVLLLPQSDPLPPDASQLVQMQYAINSYRYSHGLSTMPIDLYLTYAVNSRAFELRDTCTFAHDDVGERIWGMGYPLVGVGEILAANGPDPAVALSAWLESPSHKAILDADWASVGIAIVSYNQPCQWQNVWVVDFGK